MILTVVFYPKRELFYVSRETIGVNAMVYGV